MSQRKRRLISILFKLKTKLRNAIRGFLGIKVIEAEFDRYKSLNDFAMNDQDRNINSLRKSLRSSEDKINTLHTTLSNVVSFGSDIYKNQNRYDRSWAVVCIEGNNNIVKFVDLSSKDARDVLNVLKSFEGGRYVNDTPMSYLPKEMFIDWNEIYKDMGV